MLSGLAQAGTKALGGARFSLVNFVPSACLVGFLVFLSASGLYAGKAPDFRLVATTLGQNAGWAVTAIFGVFIVAMLMRPFQVALVQALEGYWQRLPMLSRIQAVPIELHRRKRDTAAAVLTPDEITFETPTGSLHEIARVQRLQRKLDHVKSRASAVYDRYPKRDQDLMPTLLGNALRRGEYYAGERYGLNFDAIAPRLYPSISPKLNAVITQSLDLLDTMVAMCVVFAVTVIASLPLVGRGDLWSLTPLIAAALSVIAYLGALRIARGHAGLLATAVDLHRFDMLAALHYELPTTPQEEFAFNRDLSDFLGDTEKATELMDNYRYVHPAQEASQSEPSPTSNGG